MSKTMSKPRKKSEVVVDFFTSSKLGMTILAAATMIFVGAIPAIVISMAP